MRLTEKAQPTPQTQEATVSKHLNLKIKGHFRPQNRKVLQKVVSIVEVITTVL